MGDGLPAFDTAQVLLKNLIRKIGQSNIYIYFFYRKNQLKDHHHLSIITC